MFDLQMLDRGMRVPLAAVPGGGRRTPHGVARGTRLARPFAAALTGALLLLAVPSANAGAVPESFADLAAKVTPAVVNISSTHSVSGRQDMPEMPFDFPKGSPFEEFFKRYFKDYGKDQWREMGRHVTALGSGFIIDPSGYVVTNNHVIDEATDIQVTLNGGEQYSAKLVGKDNKTDLALLKIDAPSTLPYVQLGDSDAVRVGDWVLAVGNPFGLGGTVTTGIVSARSRDIHSGPFDDFLQIDASINQGNSGGPTFNLDGQVIGINTAIASPNGGSVGIGFAIPANLAKPVIEQLREHGTVARGWLGVEIQAVTAEIAPTLGLDKPKGALIANVQPNSPAARAKLHQGDVVLGFDGKDVDEMRDLPRLVAAVPAGKTVDVVVWRDRAKMTVAVEIAKLKEGEEQVASAEEGATDQSTHSSELLGLTLAKITPELKREYGLSDTVSGVLVVDVREDGPAAEQGLREGDVIVRVSQKSVTSPDEIEALAKAAKEANQNALLMLVNRGGNELFVAVKVDKA